MTSLLTTFVRLLHLRRRHAVIGLFICFAVCLFIYSAIPSRHRDLDGMVIHRVGDAKNVVMSHSGSIKEQHRPPAKIAVVDEGERKARPELPEVKGAHPKALSKRITAPKASPPAPSLEALASRKKVGGVEVFSGNLAQVVLVPHHFNISAERVSRLEENTMLFRQLQQQVRDTRAYLASVQPDFDVNAGACRCGQSISIECACCAKLTMKRFLLERQACVNFTYVLKDHLLRVRLGYHHKRIAERTLSAAKPPMLCAGGPVYMCSAFRNVTYKVQLDSVDHKTSLSGCLDLIMRLKTRPIAIYPMGCFHLGRDPKLVHIDKMNNWMP